MLKIAKTEFYKLKRYSVVWIGVATMLTVVLLTRFMATASDGAVHTLEYFSNSVIWNNFSLIFPATITLIAGYIIERERVDDTLKNILTIPIPLCVCGCSSDYCIYWAARRQLYGGGWIFFLLWICRNICIWPWSW